MREIKDIEQLFYHEIQVLWSAEKMLTEEMPKMIEKATNFGLKKALEMHLAETRQHLVALEAICKQLNIEPEGDFNPGMKGILEEGTKVMNKDTTPAAMDAAIIAGAQKVEHYEISGYGSAAYYAEMLGLEGIAKRLRLTLTEEQEADTKLNFLAKSIINPKALTV
ncbi:ferritin-like domain-containing protein [Rurimicrobium arvi]|uniref:Ferritin-like domain-containing protein n=1 Tax=Rurimicrobium arvi TaxID=2049916 RepID=A0ABP8N040_9BACT